MDPNETVDNLLQHAEIVLEGLEDTEEIAERATKMAELIEAIDDWICKGGFLPDRWIESISIPRPPVEAPDEDEEEL